MKIIEVNAGILTNFEVLDLLRSRGASKDPLRNVLTSVSSSELKVFDYLVETAACNQTRESISKFNEKCSKFKLSKAEILNIINNRPSEASELFAIIEECDDRGMSELILEDLLELVLDVLPPAPKNVDDENNGDINTEKVEGIHEGGEETHNAERADAS